MQDCNGLWRCSERSGRAFFLHRREQVLKGGRKVTLYYFAGSAGDGAMDELPQGYVVVENERTGLPLLKKG